MRTTRILGCLAAAALLIAGSAFGSDLTQVNPAKKAQSPINMSGYANEYPWFSGDGKLFLWTRQLSGVAIQRVWVTYIRNHASILGTPAGNALPALDVATPKELEPVNDWVDPNETIKAIAVCEEGNQPDDLGNRWRYRFSLFMAVGPASGGKMIYRAHRIFVVVSKPQAKGEVAEITDMGISGLINPVPGTDAPDENETEPALASDGEYLFWASGAFQNSIARFIGPVTQCTQVAQASKDYSQLPFDDFRWKDQYTSGLPKERTSHTNYHTVLERPDERTALIFEKCHGQVDCPDCDNPDLSNRDCQCCRQDTKPNQRLSTTGFDNGGAPNEIANCCSPPLNGNFRTTHPAVAGPRGGNGHWILFYMRGHDIWYTKIEEN